MKKQGEILLTMDGNAKLGLLGEDLSRNGKLLMHLIETNNLVIMNKDAKCQGKVTRQNTKNPEEQSAIDFIVTSQECATWLHQMTIDEKGEIKVRGKNPTDHNTIMVQLLIPKVDRKQVIKQTHWNLRASETKWKNFSLQLERRCENAYKIMLNPDANFHERYRKWSNEYKRAAWASIGKTTIKQNSKAPLSFKVKKLMQQKNDIKRKISGSSNSIILSAQYIKKRDEIRNQIAKEKTEKAEKTFQRIIKDRSGKLFWKEKRRMTQNKTLEFINTKNSDGERLYGAKANIENAATYFENLFKKKEIPFHEYHDTVKKKMYQFSNELSHDDEDQNAPPTKRDIETIIKNKKNGKSTTDFKNEMLKRTGSDTVEFLWPVFLAVWQEEVIPEPWNEGLITSIYKGKGDREMLKNHRGITVSSSIGSILEELIDKRIENTVTFTQAQGGGQKGTSTCDHVFILRSIIAISQKQKQNTFLTFYDVAKAYDNACNDNMLTILWERGLRGKVWRLLHGLTKNLSARVKTRYGVSKAFNMEIGGRQGSRLTGRMFAKQMDVLSEELMNDDTEALEIEPGLKIGALLWIDDLVSCVEGDDNQEKMLSRVDEFAKRNKIKWGLEKCRVMQIGKKKETRDSWKFGSEEIKTCDEYKYLGDIITADGKDNKNIESRKAKLQGSIVQICNIAGNDALRKIQTAVLIQLYHKISTPKLLMNAEAWCLTKTMEKEVNQIEIRCWKRLFNLPVTTPNVAVIFSFGTIYASMQVDTKQMIYLHKILKRETNHWTRQIFGTLKKFNTGWYKQIKKKLEEYELETDTEKIKTKTRQQWKCEVHDAVEKANLKKLQEECYDTTSEGAKVKGKTLYAHKMITEDSYQRKPMYPITELNQLEAKTLILARFRMLECGKNFRGTSPELCTTCNEIDDESHRLNSCPRFRHTNLCEAAEKVEFSDVFSNDFETVKNTLKAITKVWNIRSGGMN